MQTIPEAIEERRARIEEVRTAAELQVAQLEAEVEQLEQAAVLIGSLSKMKPLGAVRRRPMRAEPKPSPARAPRAKAKPPPAIAARRCEACRKPLPPRPKGQTGRNKRFHDECRPSKSRAPASDDEAAPVQPQTSALAIVTAAPPAKPLPPAPPVELVAVLCRRCKCRTTSGTGLCVGCTYQLESAPAAERAAALKCARCGKPNSTALPVCVECEPSSSGRKKLKREQVEAVRLERRHALVEEVKSALVRPPSPVTAAGATAWQKTCPAIDAETGKRCSLLFPHVDRKHNASGREFTSILADGALPRRELDTAAFRGRPE